MRINTSLNLGLLTTVLYDECYRKQPRTGHEDCMCVELQRRRLLWSVVEHH